jgi:hypothetical protein
MDPQMLEREKQRVRSWEQVEKVHEEQMERLRREASDPVSLNMRQVVTEVTRNLYLVPAVIILLGFGARSEAAWLSKVIFLSPSVALAGLYLLNIDLVIYIIALPLAFFLFERSRARDSIT